MNLESTTQIEWTPAASPTGVQPIAVHFGRGAQPIQIAIAHSQETPSRVVLKSLFQDRKGKLPVFVIVAVTHGESASVFGPDPDSETLVLKRSTAEAVLNSILDQDNEISAYQRALFLWRSKQTTDMVGFTNNGLFASHFIRTSINLHAKWSQAQVRSAELQNLRDKELITGLGFEISATPSSTLLLSAKGQDKRVVAILLDRSENFDAKSIRLQASPVEWSLGIAAQQGAPWVIAIKDSQLRLYPAKDGVGVGQKSQAETYFEIDLLTVDEEKVGLLDLIFSAEALAEGGTAEGLLSDSKKFASELGIRLRERVYEQVVPPLATEIANQLRTKGHELDSKGLQLAYELTLRVLFRLLFQAYAEDRGLLPAGRNEIFDSNSMKHWAEHLLNRDSSIPFGDSSTIWFDLMQVWDAIDQGNPEMQIPAYNGGLFGNDPDLHPTGSLIRTLSIPDRVMGPALRALVVDEVTEDGVPGAVDFRSLSVREFGTIYEGLLESSLSVADQDLTVDSKGAWVPAKDNDQVLARANQVYFHSASGERKATGSYYTPSFIVDHLIERSVEPALNDHLAKVKELIDSGDQAAAYKLFFDFRVADLAMGSAHFLVAAIDKIESIMRSFLVQPGNNIEGVNAELIRLEEAAKKALGKDEAAYAEIERASLLRRQIARRCIYGLDINPLAVELSRLAIWIHTFVPGLPMSSLEHNLVCANSLTGIGSVDEGLNALIPERAKGQSTLFDGIVEQSLSEAKALLEEVASADEADKQQALKAAEVAKQARVAAAKSKMIFDLAVANRNGVISSGAALDEADLADLSSNQSIAQLISSIQPAHMPYLFPEVFLRDNSGFDVLLGNPPWEKLKVDEEKWWGRFLPGLRSQNHSEMNKTLQKYIADNPKVKERFNSALEETNQIRKTILCSPFPGLGSGDVDLYQAFAWKYLQLTRKRGITSIVLPRIALSGSGLKEFRKSLLQSGSLSELTFLVNRGGWVFESVHQQYTIALVTFSPESQEAKVSIQGPYSSQIEWAKGKLDKVVVFSEEVSSWFPTLMFPLTGSSGELSLFSRLMKNPRIGDKDETWDFRFVKGDLDSSNDKGLFNVSGSEPTLDVWGGASFQTLLWTSKTFAQLDSGLALAHMRLKLSSAIKNSRSAYFGLDLETALSQLLNTPRIAYRIITRATDTRSCIPTFLPPGVLTVGSVGLLLNRSSSEETPSLLFGLLSSRIFDWMVRRVVELNLTSEIMLSLPRPDLSSGQAIQTYLSKVVRSWLDSQLSGSGNSESERQRMQVQIDAAISSLFALSDSDVSLIYASFHRGWKHEAELQDVLETRRTLEGLSTDEL